VLQRAGWALPRSFFFFAIVFHNKHKNKRFTEALAIGETLKIIDKIDSQQNFAIFSDSESVLKEINNTFTMNNTSHITQMLKDKMNRLEWREKHSILLDPGALDLK
jgi:ribonuclease HI